MLLEDRVLVSSVSGLAGAAAEAGFGRGTPCGVSSSTLLPWLVLRRGVVGGCDSTLLPGLASPSGVSGASVGGMGWGGTLPSRVCTSESPSSCAVSSSGWSSLPYTSGNYTIFVFHGK